MIRHDGSTWEPWQSRELPSSRPGRLCHVSSKSIRRFCSRDVYKSTKASIRMGPNTFRKDRKTLATTTTRSKHYFDISILFDMIVRTEILVRIERKLCNILTI